MKNCSVSTIFKPASKHSLDNFSVFRKLLEFMFIILQQVSLQLGVGVRISYGKFCRNFHCFRIFVCIKFSWNSGIFWTVSSLHRSATAPWILSRFAEITVRRINSMFSSPPLKWTDFFPFSLLLSSPLSRAPLARNIGWQLSAKLSIICSAVLSQSPSGLSD